MATLQLKINGAMAFEGPAPDGQGRTARTDVGRVSPISYNHNYDDPVELNFRVDGRNIFQPAFPADALVELTVDGTTVFQGLLDPVRPDAAVDRPPTQLYKARDHSYAARQARFIDVFDQTAVSFSGGKLSDVLADYLERVESELQRIGISTTFRFIGQAAFAQCFPVTTSSGTIDGGFREIAAATMGVRCHIVPVAGIPTYEFVPIFASDPFDLAFEDVRIAEFSIAQSVEGRVGAVRTIRQADIGTFNESNVEEMTPAWDPAREASYSPIDANIIDADGTQSDVFRRWDISAFAENMPHDAILEARAYIKDSDPPRYVRIEVEKVDWANLTVLLKHPAIELRYTDQPFGRDVLPRGRAKAATTLLQYSVTSEAPIDIPSHRVPEEGFGGRAWQLAPVTCGYEKLIAVPDVVARNSYGRQVFAVLSEPVISGDLPINGDLPLELYALNRRINVARLSGEETGHESLLAPLLGVEVAFEHGVTATLNFSTDRSSLLRGGAG